jgi:hypothetical protein
MFYDCSGKDYFKLENNNNFEDEHEAGTLILNEICMKVRARRIRLG